MKDEDLYNESMNLVEEIWRGAGLEVHDTEDKIKEAKKKWARYLESKVIQFKEQVNIDACIGYHVRKIMELLK